MDSVCYSCGDGEEKEAALHSTVLVQVQPGCSMLRNSRLEDDMFDSGRAPPLQPTFSYRRWEGSGVASRRRWWHLVEWQSFSSSAGELGEEWSSSSTNLQLQELGEELSSCAG